MPKGIYIKTKEHIEKLKPHLLKNFREKVKRCIKCGRLIGKKKAYLPNQRRNTRISKTSSYKKSKRKKGENNKKND